MLTINSASNPKYADTNGVGIVLDVVFEEHGEAPLPFLALPDDVEEHGRELYARAAAGEFGAIASYTPPSNETLAIQARLYRNNLLSLSDWTQLPDVPQATKELWGTYRQTLREVTSQAGFPTSIVWPTVPQ
jgi:hypothetical protein